MTQRISVTVHPRSSRRRIEQLEDGLHVWLTSAPVGGSANEELLRLLSAHFGISRSAVHLASGRTSRRKVVEIG